MLLTASILYVFLALLFVFVVFGIIVYNRFIKLQQRSKEAWSDIDVQLKRRYDLIPNLLETVKGYASHEQKVLENVTKARAMAVNASDVNSRSKAEGELSQSLKSLFAVAENYPQLKSAPNFLELQKELTDTEDKIQAARRFYNSNVKDYNTRLATFPDLVIGKQFHFQPIDLFEIKNSLEREVPKVKFN